nr:MAG TPA: hypothetical protein [Herelleviridae sp.]
MLDKVSPFCTTYTCCSGVGAAEGDGVGSGSVTCVFPYDGAELDSFDGVTTVCPFPGALSRPEGDPEETWCPTSLT